MDTKKNINAVQSIQRLNRRKQRDKNEIPNPNIPVDKDRLENRIGNDPLCEGLNNPAVQKVDIIDEEDQTLNYINEPVEEVEHAQNSGEHQCPDINFELQNCYSEIHHLRETLQTYTFTMESLEHNPSKCLFYTGLPYEKMVVIYNFVEPYITNHKSVLSKFQLFIIFMMKLRLNFLFTDIGHRFNVDCRTISRVFYKVLHVMYVRLKFCIVWPERETLKKNIPRCFKEYFGGKVTVIIDCFEIFTETPKNKQAASQHFSNYKHHNTIKYLIGISPQGSIMFISEAFSGRCSDKFVTENCGILDHLLPGDCILADRGFLIQDEVKLHLAEVIIPAFMKNKKQLNPIEVEETRRLANVRIHVERVIGFIRNKYKITSSTLPMHMIKFKQNNVPVIDKILTVCCAFINLCSSIVPY